MRIIALTAAVLFALPVHAFSSTRCTQSWNGTVTCTTTGSDGFGTTRCTPTWNGGFNCTSY